MRSNSHKTCNAVLGLILGLALAGTAAAQAPPAPVPTIWDKLGFTNACTCLQSKLVNPLGNHPECEKKPLLKTIADPANLDPKMPLSIQAAAQIKQQEDLAPQKIKAIKYLATIGCGCYAKKVPVRKALVEALDDCTEEVRYEAAKALAEVAGDPCAQCGETCCNADTMNKLQELASGKNANGCFKEASEDVRNAAQTALDACRRKLPPGPEVAPMPTPVVVPIPGGEVPHPIKPSDEHPSGVRDLPPPGQPVPHVAPQLPVPPPPADLKKPLEVPGDPSSPTVAAPHGKASSVTIVEVKPIGYESVGARLPATDESRALEQPASEQRASAPEAVLRVVIP